MPENEAQGCTSQHIASVQECKKSGINIHLVKRKQHQSKNFDWLPPESHYFVNDPSSIYGMSPSCPVDNQVIYHYLQKCYHKAAFQSDDPRTKIAAAVLVPRKQSRIKARIINKARDLIYKYDDEKQNPYEYYPNQYPETKYKAFYGVNFWMGNPYNKTSLLNTSDKYYYMEHAERAAIARAQKEFSSDSLLKNKAFMIGTCLACADCGRAIIHSGIKTVICHASPMEIMKSNKHWKDSISAAFQMFKLHDIRVWFYDGEIDNAPLIMMNGEVFDPSKKPQESDT